MRDTVSAARKRLHRFLFDSPERTDQLAGLKKAQQEELVDLVWSGRSAEARAKLTRYVEEQHTARSEASIRAAATKLGSRRDKAVYKILDAFGALARPRQVWAGSKLYTVDDVRSIEKKRGVDLVVWVQSKASIPVPFGEANPFWYH